MCEGLKFSKSVSLISFYHENKDIDTQSEGKRERERERLLQNSLKKIANLTFCKKITNLASHKKVT